MKRIGRYTAVLAAIVAGLLTMTGCDDEERISYGKLPSAARAFIETYFPAESCTYAERDRADGRREYKAVLSNGTEIEFDAAGQWTEVDCKFSLLPAASRPNGSSRTCRPLSRRRNLQDRTRPGGYEVTIGSGLELIYSADGTFVREERY